MTAVLQETRDPQSGWEFDRDKVDQMILALLHLTSFTENNEQKAWKNFDWEALHRLHKRGLIENPFSQAKTVSLTKQGAKFSHDLFYQNFGTVLKVK